MRTLVGAADPPPRRPPDGFSFTRGGSTSSTASAVIVWLASAGHTVTPWQEHVVREAYRTTAYVGEPVPEIEGRGDDVPEHG